MTQVPADVNAWTYDTIMQLLTDHSGEPSWFDFKANLGDTRESTRKTAAAMANTDGGYLIFGVKDAAAGLTLAERITGLPHDAEFRKTLGDVLACIKPLLRFLVRDRPIDFPSDPTRGIQPVRIPPSATTGHGVGRNGGWFFYRRGDGGQAVPMDYYEVRDQMLYGAERLRKVQLLRLELVQMRDDHASLASTTLPYSAGYDGKPIPDLMLRFDTSDFRPLIADVCGLLPASGTVLADLLRICSTANLVNRRLDRIISTIPPWDREGNTKHMANIRGTLAVLAHLIADTEQALDTAFGPLSRGHADSAAQQV